VEFRLHTDDTVGASRWAEFFSTRFVLGKENAAFTITGGSALHVPSGAPPRPGPRWVGLRQSK
jgi:hypothetical protein